MFGKWARDVNCLAKQSGANYLALQDGAWNDAPPKIYYLSLKGNSFDCLTVCASAIVQSMPHKAGGLGCKQGLRHKGDRLG